MNNLQRFLLGLIVLEIPFQIDKNLFHLDDRAAYGAIGGLNVSLTTFCLAVLYVLWVVSYAVQAGYPRRRALFISVPLTAYFAVAALSLLLAFDRQLASFGICLLLQAYLIYFYVSNHVQTQNDVVFVVSMLVVAMAMQSIVMIGTGIVGHDLQVGPISATISFGTRVAGTLGSPVTAASYLALLLAPSLAVLATPLGRSYKVLATVALALGGVALLLTLSRGAWIAVGLSFSLFWLLAWRRRLISTWLPATFAVALLIVGLAFQESIANRVFGDDAGSAHSRLPLAQMAWNMISDRPLLGVGENNCAVVATEYAMWPEFRQEWFYTIHNKYLLVWVETGIVALAAFLWFLTSTLRQGWSAWQRRDRWMSPIALGLTVAIAGQMVHMLVDIFNSRPQVQMLWLCAGLVAAIYHVDEDE